MIDATSDAVKGLRIPLVVLAVLTFLAAAQAQKTITKCQDADGNWHYGDFAAEACAQESTITEIDERGVKVRESDAPPTQEELEARKSEEKRQQQEAAQQARDEAEDRRLLRTYDTAQSIVEARDDRVEALNRDLESHQLFRQDLVDEKEALPANDADDQRIESLDRQIEQYDKTINQLQAERRETIEKYNRELERYREIAGE